MLILLSPAKTLDMAPATTGDMTTTLPRLLDQTEVLARRMKEFSVDELGELMSISDKLAELNYVRFQEFATDASHRPGTGAPALLAFRGDVYQDLGADDFSEREMEFANQQIRILSGLYGILRPRDTMQAYRLEMGTKLRTDRGDNLYDFWGNRITELLNEDLKDDPAKLVLNLASQEYLKVVDTDALDGRVLNIHFKEERKDKLRTISFNAKRARGCMARLITLEGIAEAEPLKELSVNDYTYREELSGGDDWVYVRD